MMFISADSIISSDDYSILQKEVSCYGYSLLSTCHFLPGVLKVIECGIQQGPLFLATASLFLFHPSLLAVTLFLLWGHRIPQHSLLRS